MTTTVDTSALDEMSWNELKDSRDTLTREALEISNKYDSEDDIAGADLQAYIGLANDLGPVVAEIQNREKQRGSLDETKRYLRSMGADPTDIGTTESIHERMSGQTGIARPGSHMTLGQRVTGSGAIAERVVASESYQSFVAQWGKGGSISDNFTGRSAPIDIHASLFSASQNARGIRNTLITSDEFGPTGADIVQPTMLPMQDEDPFDTQFLWDLCTRWPVSGEGFKYPILKSRVNNAAFVSESTSSADTGDGTGGTLLPTAANGYKPESELQWDQASGTVETIAHWIPLTRQAAARVPTLIATIQTFLRDGLDAAAHEGMITGDGNSPNIRGILNTTNPYPNVHSISVGAGDRFTAIMAAMATIKSSRKNTFRANAIVINTLDYYSTQFLGAQDANQQWQFGGPAAPPAALNPWGLRAIVSDSVPQGTQLVGDFRYALIADAQRTQMYITDSHKDWFTRNLLAILAEMEMGFALMAEQAFAQIVA